MLQFENSPSHSISNFLKINLNIKVLEKKTIKIKETLGKSSRNGNYSAVKQQ